MDVDDGLPPYSAWDEDGDHPLLYGDLKWREGVSYLNTTFGYLSGDDYELRAEGGAQGSYRIDLLYDEFAVHRLPDGSTPYGELGGDRLSLPAGWIHAPTTNAMTGLANASNVAIGHTRAHTGLAMGWIANPLWTYNVRFDQRRVQGLRDVGAPIGTSFASAQSAILPMPVDNETNDVVLSTLYAGYRLHMQFDLNGSWFRNANESLRWENAFDTAAAVPMGRIGLEPDNAFYQGSASGRYDFTDDTQVTFRFAYGRMLQDEGLLAYTVNPAITASALPRASADARIDTWNTDLKLSSALSERFRLEAAFKHEELENFTPQDLFTYVVADTAETAIPRQNLPYSFRRQRLSATGHWRLDRARAQAGISLDAHARTYQAVEDSTESALWAQWVAEVGESTQWLTQVRLTRREGDYENVPAVTPAENPLARQFHLADRDSADAKLRIDHAAGALASGIELRLARFDYPDTRIGLKSSDERVLAADAAYLLAERWTLGAFAAWQQSTYDPSGSAAYADPDWSVEGDDEVTSVGLNAVYRRDAWRLAADVAYTRTRARIDADVDYPDVRIDGVKILLTMARSITPKTDVSLRYISERQYGDDWAVTGLAPTTVENVLTLGGTRVGYDTSSLAVALVHRF